MNKRPNRHSNRQFNVQGGTQK